MLQADVQFSKAQILLMDVFFAQLFQQQQRERADDGGGVSPSGGSSSEGANKDQRADIALLAGQDSLFVVFKLEPLSCCSRVCVHAEAVLLTSSGFRGSGFGRADTRFHRAPCPGTFQDMRRWRPLY